MKNMKIRDDTLFKRIFGGGTKESRRILTFILDVFLHMDVNTIEVLNPTFTTGRQEKQMIADILLCVNGKDFVIIEMQNYYRRDNHARFVSYESILTMLRRDRGQAYDFGKNIVLVFSGYSNRKDGVVNDEIICHRYDDGYVYSDKYIIRIVELQEMKKLIHKPVSQMTQKERYKFFIAFMGYDEMKWMIDEIVKEEEGLRMTLAEIYKTTEEKDIPAALMNWAAEYDMMQDQLYEEERERELEKRKSEIENKKQELAKSNAEIESKKQEIERRNAEIESKKQEIERRKAEIESKKQEIERRNAELESKEQELKEVKVRASKAEQESERLKQEEIKYQKLRDAVSLIARSATIEEALKQIEILSSTLE